MLPFNETVGGPDWSEKATLHLIHAGYAVPPILVERTPTTLTTPAPRTMGSFATFANH